MGPLSKAIATGSLTALLALSSHAFAQADTADQAADTTTQPASPSKINLDLDGAGAEEAFDQLAKQAGVELFTQDQQTWFNADPVFIKVENGSFWPTFLEMCKQSRLDFDANNGFGRSGSIRVYFNGGNSSRYSKYPAVTSEGFVIMATNANRTYSVDYSNIPSGPRPASFGIQLLVFVDPARQILQIGQPAITEAIDENGVSLMLNNNNNGNVYYGGEMGLLVRNTGVQLSYPANAGKKIARLKGALRATVASKVDTITVDNLLTTPSTKKDFADYDVTLDQPKKLGNNQYQMKITVRFKDRGPIAGVRHQNRDFWPLINSMVITDADGHRYSNNGGGGGGGDQVVSYTTNFSSFSSPDSGIGEPAKLTWRLPTQTRELRIPFELKDLPIP